MTSRKTGEFERIASFFAPLAADFPGALGLLDDAAVMRPAEGCQLVVTTDTIVAGVHYIGDEPADLVAQKLLRVNLSDLAAKGARPVAYTLNIALPSEIDDDWLERFAAGLAADQRRFGIALAGGDSVSTPGPVTLTITAIGEVAAGAELRRVGARPGDAIYVTGTIGDGALGLKVLRGGLAGLSEAHRAALTGRYRLPQPRVACGPRLVGLAHGLDRRVRRAGRRSRPYRRGLRRRRGRRGRRGAAVRPPARRRWQLDPALRESVLGGGDDYELLFTAPAERGGPDRRAGRRAGPADNRHRPYRKRPRGARPATPRAPISQLRVTGFTHR